MKSIAIRISVTFLLFIIQNHSFAQVNTVFQKFDKYRKDNFQEKVYVTTDREFYLAGEIIWFKVYGMDGSLHHPTNISKIIYVEVISSDSTAHLQAKVELNDGCGSGSFYVPTSMASGSYVLRAYTNWMKNYDAEFYFHKEITIVNTFRQLQRKTFADSIDLQFYPEGGHLVAGIESKVAFQAINAQGKGLDFEGILMNVTGDTILSFSPEHAGFGSFNFVPELGVSYKAIVESNGKTFYMQLPLVDEFGFVLSVEGHDDMVSVSVESNTSNSGVYLLVQSRNIVSHSLHKSLNNGKTSFLISKKDLADGINHFTLFNDDNEPVAERLFFKQPEKLMSINIKGEQKPASVKEKIIYQISTVGNPKSKLSMSVYKLDSLNKETSANIVDYLYLVSDLQAPVSNPSYYLGNQSPEKHTDLLMMVHGWSRFNWDEVLAPVLCSKKYVPELRGHLIQGNVHHKENSVAAEGIYTYLSVTGDFPRFYVSKSDAKGKIEFELQDSFGGADIVIGTNQILDSIYKIEISDPFSKDFSFFNQSKMSIDETLEKSLIDRSIDMQTLNIYQKENINKFKSTDSETTLFYNKADKIYMLDDFTRFSTMEDIMREYMPEVYVYGNKDGYTLRILDNERKAKYQRNPLILYDGIPVFDINKFMRVDPHSIQSMEVVRKRYFYGKKSFDGIISCQSFGHDLDGIEVDPTSLLLKYEFAQLKRTFYAPVYSTNSHNTTPDRRNLLYWNADIITNDRSIAEVEFSTSEESGKYLIVIDGISATGRPGYTSLILEVEDDLN